MSQALSLATPSPAKRRLVCLSIKEMTFMGVLKGKRREQEASLPHDLEK